MSSANLPDLLRTGLLRLGGRLERWPRRAIIAWYLVVLAGAAHASGDQAPMLDLSLCAGALELRQNPALVQPRWKSAVAAVRARSATVRAVGNGWAMQCHAPTVSVASTARGVVISNRAIGKTAVAVQNIGDHSDIQREGPTTETSALVLELPIDTRVVARAWSGTLQMSEGNWWIDMELAAGHVHASRAHHVRMVIDAGDVILDEARGVLSAHVRGVGHLKVSNMRDPELDLNLSGSGSLSLRGRAASARVRASGVGSIDIERVSTEPWLQVGGLVDISVGR